MPAAQSALVRQASHTPVPWRHFGVAVPAQSVSLKHATHRPCGRSQNMPAAQSSASLHDAHTPALQLSMKPGHDPLLPSMHGNTQNGAEGLHT